VSGHAPQGAIASLDGIRALAVSLVFFAHGGLEDVVPGGLGVTIFFVLSGFLITTLMRREYRSGGTLNLRAFYLRRVLRLMPPLLVVVAAAALLAALGLIGGAFSGRGLLAVLFYFGNYHVIAADFHGVPEGIGVVWSLAVEEHYYLLFPPLAIVLLRLGRPRAAAAILVALCLAILGWRTWLALHGATEHYLTMATDTRADAILAGCALAFWRNPALEAPPPGSAARDGALAAACLLLLLGTLAWRDELFRVTARYTLQSLAIAPLIWLAVARAPRAPWRWLGARPLVYVGTVSYTIYLSHQVILYGVVRHAPALGGLATLALTALLTLAVAEAMRRWVEAPCARRGRQLHGPHAVARRAAAPLAGTAR